MCECTRACVCGNTYITYIWVYTYTCVYVVRYPCTCIYAHIHTHKLQVSLDPQTPVVSLAVSLVVLVPPVVIISRCLIHRKTHAHGSQVTHRAGTSVQLEVYWCLYTHCQSSFWHCGRVGHSDLQSHTSCYIQRPICTHAEECNTPSKS